MDYEVLSSGNTYGLTGLANKVCPSVNGVCPSVNGVCPGTNAVCGGTDSGCPNNFPCENPGFGCRAGCGCGTITSNCVAVKSLPTGTNAL